MWGQEWGQAQASALLWWDSVCVLWSHLKLHRVTQLRLTFLVRCLFMFANILDQLLESTGQRYMCWGQYYRTVRWENLACDVCYRYSYHNSNSSSNISDWRWKMLCHTWTKWNCSSPISQRSTTSSWTSWRSSSHRRMYMSLVNRPSLSQWSPAKSQTRQHGNWINNVLPLEATRAVAYFRFCICPVVWCFVFVSLLTVQNLWRLGEMWAMFLAICRPKFMKFCET